MIAGAGETVAQNGHFVINFIVSRRTCALYNCCSICFVVVSVLNELDGLCRSRLANEARSALAFLREKNPQVRYVTSKGAPLPTFAAGTMTEESDDQVCPSIHSTSLTTS